MKRIFEILKSALDAFSEDRCWTFSASLSYYAVFSMPWVLLITVYIAGWIVGEQSAAGEIYQRIQYVAGPEVARQIETMLREASRSGGQGALATSIGVAAIIFSSTTGFAELQFALNQAWEVQPEHSGWGDFAAKRVLSFLMVIATGMILLALMALRTIISAVGATAWLPFSSVWQGFFVWLTVTILVAAIFKILPDATIAWEDVAVSAVFTGTLLTASRHGISAYLGHTSIASTFGAAGSLAIILLWLYISSAILLFGAEFARAWSRSRGHDVVPQKGAMHTNPEKGAA